MYQQSRKQVCQATTPAAGMGVVGPAGMPKDIAMLLSTEVAKIMKMPDVRERFIAEGAEPIGSTGAEMNAFLVKDVERWTAVVKTVHFEAK
ncbi:hypothetical protein ACTMU2_16460 [Cupriavidus basilensis]